MVSIHAGAVGQRPRATHDQALRQRIREGGQLFPFDGIADRGRVVGRDVARRFVAVMVKHGNLSQDVAKLIGRSCHG